MLSEGCYEQVRVVREQSHVSKWGQLSPWTAPLSFCGSIYG